MYFYFDVQAFFEVIFEITKVTLQSDELQALVAGHSFLGQEVHANDCNSGLELSTYSIGLHIVHWHSSG